MSRLSHSQHEIQGILQCSEPSEGDLSESADELDDPGPAAGPYPELREPADQADIEDMGALAHDIRDADMQEADQQQPQQQQLPSGTHSLQLLWAAYASAPSCSDIHQSSHVVAGQLLLSGYGSLAPAGMVFVVQTVEHGSGR